MEAVCWKVGSRRTDLVWSQPNPQHPDLSLAHRECQTLEGTVNAGTSRVTLSFLHVETLRARRFRHLPKCTWFR